VLRPLFAEGGNGILSLAFTASIKNVFQFKNIFPCLADLDVKQLESLCLCKICLENCALEWT